MFPAPFEYLAVRSVEEAIDALARHGYDAKVIAGGQSLLPMMKLRVAAPSVLVDLNRVEALSGWQEDAQGLRIGATTRHAALERARPLAERYPLILATAPWIADPLVRNRGTMAGSLAHADPAADWGAAFLALRGQVEVQGPQGTRAIGADDFFVDIFTTSLAADEVITAVRLPRPVGHPEATYLKLERKVGDFAVVGVALNLEVDPEGRVAQAGIGLAAVGPKPLRAPQAEAALIGQRLSFNLAREVAALAAEAADPTSDQRGSAAFKRDMVRVFVQRGLESLRQRIEGRQPASA